MRINTADRWLLERWQKLREMELAMSGTRERYENLFREIHKAVMKSHPMLDRLDVHFGSKEVENWGSNVIFSRGGWQSDYSTWRSGICLWGITLDELASDENDELSIYLFLQVKKSDERIESIRKRIADKAPQVFSETNLKWSTKDEDDNRTLLWYVMPEGKRSILKMLYGGQEQEFIDCMSNHIGLMSGFIPILDDLLTG